MQFVEDVAPVATVVLRVGHAVQFLLGAVVVPPVLKVPLGHGAHDRPPVQGVHPMRLVTALVVAAQGGG